MQFYIKIDVKYKNNEYSMLHKEWIKLDTSQEKIKSLTHNHKISIKNNNVLQTFTVKNIEDFNKLLKWLQEDEQQEFLIELHNNMIKENNTLTTRRQITVKKDNSSYGIEYNKPNNKLSNKLLKYMWSKHVEEKISSVYNEKSSNKQDVMYIYKYKSK